MAEEIIATKEQGVSSNETIRGMFEMGAHFGYSRSRRHPSVSPYIFGVKNRVEIIDLEKTYEQLERAKEFLRAQGASGKQILFVGGKNEAREILKSSAKSISAPYVAGRWIGGTLTNFTEIKKRIEHLADLMEKRDKGELKEKYTKHEQLMFDREIGNLTDNFEGLLGMSNLPDALVIVDAKQESTAFAEAKKIKRPIVALANSDNDIEEIDFPIIANDAQRASIAFFVEELAGAYKEGISKIQEKTVES